MNHFNNFFTACSRAGAFFGGERHGAIHIFALVRQHGCLVALPHDQTVRRGGTQRYVRVSRKGCRGFLRVVERGPRRGWVFLGVGGCWRDNNIFIRGWLFAAFRAISIVEWAFSAVPRFVENVPFGRVCFDWAKVRNVHNNKVLEYLYPMKTDSTITCTINYSLRRNRFHIQKISLQNKLVKQTTKSNSLFWSTGTKNALCCCPNQRAVSCRPFLCWEATK